MPYNLLTGHKFAAFLRRSVNVFVVELKLSTERAGVTIHFL